MALVTCPKCSKQVSNKAQNCPYCGCLTLDLLEQSPTLKALQTKLESFPKFQNRFSVKVYSEGKTLIVKFTRLTNVSEPQNAYNSPWEVTRLFLRGISKDLKGMFTEFSFVGEFEGETEWSNSSLINSNGMIANTQKEIMIAAIAVPLVVVVILVIANLSKGTSTAPTTPSVQTKDPNCLYIPESSVPRGMSYGDYKDKVKRETGAKCVFFTGG